MTLFLSAIGYSDGHRRSIREAAEERDASAIAALEADGFRDFVVNDLPLPVLAAEAVDRTLARAGCGPAEIDAVVFATESHWDHANGALNEFEDPIRLRHGILRMLSERGLTQAYPYGNWLSGCANLGSSLALAKGLIESGQRRRVLLVVVDKCAPSVPRLMHNNAAVWSDLAASCLIGTEPQGLALRQIVNVAAPAAGAMDFVYTRPNLPKILHHTLTALKRLDGQFADACGRRLRDFDMVLPSHFHTLSLKVITDFLGIPPARLIRSGYEDHAHGYSADNLLTLERLQQDGALRPGQMLALFNSSVWAWNLSAVEVI